MELCGRLVSMSAYGEWARGTLEAAQGGHVPVVGKGLAALEESECYRLTGDFVVHPKYGRQFEVVDALVDAPREVADLVKFIRKQFKGCGEKTASAVVAWYQTAGGGLERLRADLVHQPWQIESCPGVGGRKIEYMDTSGAGLDVQLCRRLAAQVVSAGLTDTVLKRLSSWLMRNFGNRSDSPVDSSLSAFAQDPFRPILEVEGYGLKLAERAARALGIQADDPARLACVSFEAINAALRRHGHMFLSVRHAKRLLVEAGCQESVSTCVQRARDRGYPIEMHDERVYTTSLRRTEKLVAAHLAQLLHPSTPIWTRPLKELEREISVLESQMGEGFRLDDSQRAALVGMLTSKVRLHSLTSWPGCGKTAFLEMVAGLVKDVVFAAPYSKAAKVLNARVSRQGAAASTAHMLLEATGEGFRKNRGNQLVARVVVLDECGTVDVSLLASVLDAMSPWAHLLVVGDVDQLESVGPGQVLQDIVAIEAADHRRLTTTYRNGGAILPLVGMIRDGTFPPTSPGPEVVYVNAERGELSFMDLVDLWAGCVAREGFEQVGLLFGHRAGKTSVEGWNVTYVNHLIQSLVNKPTEDNKIPGTALRVTDRVIVRKPMTLKRTTQDGEEEIVGQVANGDTGYLVSFSLNKRGVLETLRLKLDEGRTIDFPGAAVAKLELAYALTVHAAQGSEFAEVVLVVPGGSNAFMNRNLLLTGASRAQKRLWMVGREQDITSVAARERPRRNSVIADLVNNSIGR